MNNYYLVILSIFLITIIISYLFGLSLINKIEDKLNNIKINILFHLNLMHYSISLRVIVPLNCSIALTASK